MATIFTIGHSTHEIGAFLELLRGQRIELLADVRRYPGSRRMPWFNEGERLTYPPLQAQLGV